MNSELIPKILSHLLKGALVILFIVLATYFYTFHGELSQKQEVWGQFGDFFGGTVNPILSFLTLIALVFTVALQVRQLEIAHKELENSKEELKTTREELRLQRKEMEASTAKLAEQVEAQRGANRASIGQIKTASMQARIEIFKIKIEGQIPSQRVHMIEEMESIANEINQFAEELEELDLA